MKLPSAKAVTRNEPDSAAVCHEGTNAEDKENLNRLRAQMIVETLTPFLSVLSSLKPDGPPSR